MNQAQGQFTSLRRSGFRDRWLRRSGRRSCQGAFHQRISRGGSRARPVHQAGRDFSHNEIEVFAQHQLTNNPELQPVTFRKTPEEKARLQPSVMYGRCVGGSSVHFTANFWRFHEIDFIERSKVGEIPGASFADWPIRYADLEPYYTKVEWEVGVSGLAGASPFDPPRSKPYPMPPLPVKGSGVVFERAAWKLGYHPFPAPMAILSQPRAGTRFLRELRILSRLRLRSGREIQFTFRHDSCRRSHGSLRDSTQLLCASRWPWTRTGVLPAWNISTPSATRICKRRKP